jgi:hypothetical protein
VRALRSASLVVSVMSEIFKCRAPCLSSAT